MPSSSALVPKFRSIRLQEREDGYWVETFKLDPRDKYAGLLVHGLNTGNIEFLDNPGPDSLKWEQYEIAKLDTPVAIALADITGNGTLDVIVCHDYGPTMTNCNPNGGIISWFRNPGRDNLRAGQHWEQREIGRSPAMHRLKAGFFTQNSRLEVIGLPVVAGRRDLDSAVPVYIFPLPDNVLEVNLWPRHLIDNKSFHIIHDVSDKRFMVIDEMQRHSMVVASREGLTWLYYKYPSWCKEPIAAGVPKVPAQRSDIHFWGTGCVDVGKVGDDTFAYIAAIEPFHGTNVSVYVKERVDILRYRWRRHVIDVVGHPDQLSNAGNGPGHHVVCADFDGDGTDEFLVALMGDYPHQGVFYYKPVSLATGRFAKYRVSDYSAARIAIGDFTGNGKLDFATLSYNVKDYHEAKQPEARVHYNEFASTTPEPVDFAITVWNNEPMITMPRPCDTGYQQMPLGIVANYYMKLEILPPGYNTDHTEKTEAIKVIWGAVHVYGEQSVRKALGTNRFEKASSRLDGKGYSAAAGVGAVVVRFVTAPKPKGPWKDTREVPCELHLKNTLPEGETLDFSSFKFTKVENLWWGERFMGRDFWNASGIHFRFNDSGGDDLPLQSTLGIAHLQFWTAGLKVDCEYHNHDDAIFAEIHLCLSAGTGNGGMHWLDSDPTIGDLQHKLPLASERTHHELEIGELEEHGGLWFVDEKGVPLRRPNKSVCYYWHKWLAGGRKDALDIWAAFEFYPDAM